MEKFGISQPVRRVEDERFLTGKGRYTDDIAPEGAAVAWFLRSPVAHARITRLDVEQARAAEGVLGVFTAADFGDTLKNNIPALPVTNRDGSKGAQPVRPVLATDTVRYVGEPIAVIVAESRRAAKDAAELIELETEDLPVSLALEPGGPTIHAEAPGNLAYDWAFGDEEATEAAFASAAHVVRLEVTQNRIICNSMEPRAAYAEWSEDGRLHLCFGGQGVWAMKAMCAQLFGLDPERVHVTNPDVGGGFGMKVMPYNEYFAIAFAARALGRPVKWIGERGESMMSDTASRDLKSLAEAAFDENHRLVALRVNTLSNLGAYNSYMGQNIQSELALKVFPGVYDVQTAFFGVKGIYTNTTPVDAYRGAGRPEAIYVLERLMDRAARELGLSQSEIRRKNFIPAEKMPYRAVSGELYDTGDFDRVLTRAEREADVAGFPARRAESEARGKLRGLGLCYYIESILGAPQETTRIEFTEDGVNCYVGTQSNGQGHETVYRQILCEKLGLEPGEVRIVQGDSDLIPKGGGTGGSRSVTMQGNSILHTSDKVIAKFRDLASEELEAAAQDIVFENGAFVIKGTDRKVALRELVGVARARGLTELLDTSEEYNLPGRSYPNGAHFCEVEIDPETGETKVMRYTVVDDFGVLMNPLLAEGQVHGGVVQGLGQALTEAAIYDESGQLLTGSFMDYAMPRADDVPFIAFHPELIPSTANEIGMKGCGEAGTVGAIAAVMNAVQDAVWSRGVRQVDSPVTPQRMWRWLNAAAA